DFDDHMAMPQRHVQVTVFVLVDIVGMDVVELRSGFRGNIHVRLIEIDMIHDMPFENHTTRLNLEVLDNAVEHKPVFWLTKWAKIPLERSVDRHERRTARGEHDLMQIAALITIPDLKRRDLLVCAIKDQPVTNTITGRLRTLPP